MAAYNSESTIAESIQSVLNQSYENLELIVVDDASTDGTLRIARKFVQYDNRIHIIVRSNNGGAGISRKEGIAHAKGNWIAILDSDDLWLPEKLERQVLTQKETNADLIYTGSAFINETGIRKNWCLHVPETVTYYDLLKQNVVSNSSVLVRKELMETYLVDNNKIHEDFAMWLRMLKNGAVFYGIDKPLLIYRIRKSSKSGNKLKSAVMNWRTYRYTGLNRYLSCYYMIHYVFRSFLKYRHID